MAILNEKMMHLGKVRSVIRETFEYGLARKAEIGAENVFDFSLGNPSVPGPKEVDEAIVHAVQNTSSVALHGYTSAPGAPATKAAIAEDINARFNAGISASDIYMTCGAAASLTVSLHAVVNEGDEVIAIAPFFPEYRVFAEKAGAKFVLVEADTKSFQINFEALEKALSEKTKAVIINTPNNPTGVVLTEENIHRLCELLSAHSQKIGSPVFLLSDEPYRELVYDETLRLPYLTNCYEHTLVCYSFSKSLSLPGERIGYIVVSPRMSCHDDVYAAVCGAGRALGFVCAPSMMQHIIPACLGKTADLSVYRENRDLLFEALTSYGYECVRPDGAFYLFVKALEPDANKFCMKAREHELLLVASDSFGCEGYVRISYCVPTDMIRRALPAFEALADSYKN